MPSKPIILAITAWPETAFDLHGQFLRKGDASVLSPRKQLGRDIMTVFLTPLAHACPERHSNMAIGFGRISLCEHRDTQRGQLCQASVKRPQLKGI